MSRSIVVPIAAVRRAWIESDETVREIAKRFGISYGALYKLTVDQGWPRRSRRPKTAVLTREAIEGPTAAGVLDAEIAAAFGVGADAVRLFRFRHGMRKVKGKGITMAEYRAQLAEEAMAAAMAGSAAETRQLMKVCEMVDHPSCGKSKVAA